MRLEDAYDAASGIHLADAFDASPQFLRVVCIVAEVGLLLCLHAEIEATLHTGEGCHAATYLSLVNACNLCQCHSSDAVLDVDTHRNAQTDIADIPEGRHEVEDNLSIANADIVGMEVTTLTGVGVGGHTGRYIRLHL